MRTIITIAFCTLFLIACKNKESQTSTEKINKSQSAAMKEKVENFSQVQTLTLPSGVECDVSQYTSANWLSPNPVNQLGAVPVNGVPTLPANKIPGTSENCDFHIFSWQWFTYLMTPYNNDIRNFENRDLFPVVDLDTCKSISANNRVSKKSRGMTSTVLKVMDMPDIPGQAGSGDALYDKNTNLIFYNRSFTKNECNVYNDGNFPDAKTANTSFPTQVDQVLEIKTSWRILASGEDVTNYYVIEADIEGIGMKQLGLVGFHIVVNTGAHPEFVWATFEHKDNAPDCNVVIPTSGFTRPQPSNGWNLASQSCNTCIANNYKDGSDLTTLCKNECDFNNNASAPVFDSNGNVLINGAAGQTPSNICLDRNYGDAPIPQSVHNNPDIQFLNTLLVGPGGIITNLDSSNDMAVLKNYFLGGAEWTDVSKITSPSQKFDTELAGSTALSNSTLESYTQYNAGKFFETGCLSCHGGASGNNTALASHLLTSSKGAVPGLIDRCDVKAGFTASNDQAATVCPTTCENAMGWNGNWTTIPGSATSVCGCNACVSQ